MIRSIRYALGFASIAAVFVSTTSHAATTQYPGALCVQGGTLSPAVWYQSGHAEVLSSGATLECPAPQMGGKLLGAMVYGYDPNPTQSVTCTARAVDSWGGSGYWTSTMSSGNAFVGRFTLVLTAATPGFVSPGFKLLVCSMAAFAGMNGSYIGSYSITEG